MEEDIIYQSQSYQDNPPTFFWELYNSKKIEPRTMNVYRWRDKKKKPTIIMVSYIATQIYFLNENYNLQLRTKSFIFYTAYTRSVIKSSIMALYLWKAQLSNDRRAFSQEKRFFSIPLFYSVRFKVYKDIERECVDNFFLSSDTFFLEEQRKIRDCNSFLHIYSCFWNPSIEEHLS